MLQKIINGIAIASGVVSITVVGAVGIVYLNKDAIIENVKSKVMESVTWEFGGDFRIPSTDGRTICTITIWSRFGSSSF